MDETPPLRRQVEECWRAAIVTPRVNGLPRFDKPPYIYWLMALAMHCRVRCLGSTGQAGSASALATVAMMIGLADTLLRWPDRDDPMPQRTALASALFRAVSPCPGLSRTAVSDALLCALLGLSLISSNGAALRIRRGRPGGPPGCCWPGGAGERPVAVVLTGLTMLLFAALRRDLHTLWQRLRPCLACCSPPSAARPGMWSSVD